MVAHLGNGNREVLGLGQVLGLGLARCMAITPSCFFSSPFGHFCHRHNVGTLLWNANRKSMWTKLMISQATLA